MSNLTRAIVESFDHVAMLDIDDHTQIIIGPAALNDKDHPLAANDMLLVSVFRDDEPLVRLDLSSPEAMLESIAEVADLLAQRVPRPNSSGCWQARTLTESIQQLNRLGYPVTEDSAWMPAPSLASLVARRVEP